MKGWIIIIIAILLAGLVFLGGYAMQREPTLNFSVTNVTESRQKEVILTVADSNNMPVKNAKISYEQLSQDFMYNVGEYWDEGATGLGTNTEGVYLDWNWGKLEPEDGVYDWSYLGTTGILDENGGLKPGHAEHIFLRLGVIATSAWIVGEKMDAFQETGYPQWIDRNNLTQVKTKYLEFVAALLDRLKFEPDFYMIEVEINALGINAGMTNQQVVEWLNQLANKIKETDPEAKVSIVVTSSDLSPFMEEYRANNRLLVEQDKFPLRVTEFLEQMKGVNYDMISVPIQPFGWISKGDSADAIKFIDSLCGFNKTVYIAWASFLAGQPEVPEELNPRPDGVNTTGFVYYPNPQASEEWQKEQTLDLMNYLISNPRIMGVHWDMLDYVETGTGGKDVRIKLATGFTSGYREANDQIIKGEKRLVYEPMKELWKNLFSRGTLQTDDNGRTGFNGLPGRYRIVVSHPDYKTKEMTIDI